MTIWKIQEIQGDERIPPLIWWWCSWSWSSGWAQPWRLLIIVRHSFTSFGLLPPCGAPLFLWRSPKPAEALFYQWLPQMRAAPPNLFLKKAYRKWPFSHPKNEENGPKKKLWLDIYVEKGFCAKESAQLVIPVRSTFQNDLHPPIGGPHPVLYFTTQIKKKYCTAMC